MVMSGVPPPMVDALRRVRGCLSGTRLWTCCAGRAGTRMRSEALHRMLTIGRSAAHHAGARPYHRTTASNDGRCISRRWFFPVQFGIGFKFGSFSDQSHSSSAVKNIGPRFCFWLCTPKRERRILATWKRICYNIKQCTKRSIARSSFSPCRPSRM
jgi:hypothetical protein